MRLTIMLAGALLAASYTGGAADFDAAAAFGARPSVESLTLSPDGKTVAYVAPSNGQGSILFTLSLDKDAKSRKALALDGNPTRLGDCNWVSNERLVCSIYGVVKAAPGILPFNRLVAVNRDGGKLQTLSTAANSYSRGYLLDGGSVIDWLPDEDGAILMSREHLADDHTGSQIAGTRPGLSVDHIDTLTLNIKTLEPAKEGAVEYLTDGRGNVRIVEFRGPHGATGQDTGVYNYQYRLPNSTQWRKMSSYDSVDRSGFEPYVVDHDSNLAYGIKKLDGRLAIYSMKLDETLHEELVYGNPQVDVTTLIRLGRRKRIVGLYYVTDKTHTVFFDKDLEKLISALSNALPEHPSLRLYGSSVDENKLLFWASRDTNPGSYFVYDKTTHELRPLFLSREELDGVQLAEVTPTSFPAADGTQIPGYITYPPGKEKTKGLPAIVMPHGGPGSRDVWGFDWLVQFYANRGFVVLQPNFRGSTGFGDTWYLKNGFRSWPIAIGDVLDAGRWLVRQGIADPSKLAIVGWSYGGYAALQSAVTDSSVFKAVIAIAPVTDLNDLKEESRGWTDFKLVANFVGDGVREASPAQNAASIKVPVLLFHGQMDRNVAINESRHMDRSLAAANVPHELVIWEDLDHQLDDSKARAEMLRKSEVFLRKNLNL